MMPNPANTPEESERETYRIWDWDAQGNIVHLEATVDVYYLPVGHPENKKPYPRPEFNLVSLKTLEGQDYALSEQLRRSVYLAIDTRIQEEFFTGIEAATETQPVEPEAASAQREPGVEGWPLETGHAAEEPDPRAEARRSERPGSPDQGRDAGQKKGQGRGR